MPHVAFTVALSTHSNGSTRHSHTFDPSYRGLALYKPTSTNVMVAFPIYNFIFDLRVNQVTRSLKLNRGPSIPSRTDHLAISEMSVAAGVDPTVMVSATTSGSRYTERQRVTHHTKFNRSQHTPSQCRTRLQPAEHHNYDRYVSSWQ